MFNFGNIFSSLLSGPVGTGMPSEADDVKKTRRNFASIGRYDGDTELGYIDRKLDETIRVFQREDHCHYQNTIYNSAYLWLKETKEQI